MLSGAPGNYCHTINRPSERTLNWLWQKFPRVTENGPISWALKGKDEMLLKDDKGKEFTLTITKTRIKDPISK